MSRSCGGRRNGTLASRAAAPRNGRGGRSMAALMITWGTPVLMVMLRPLSRAQRRSTLPEGARC
jgi:hypothetical protein